jgi:hypothetical protein
MNDIVLIPDIVRVLVPGPPGPAGPMGPAGGFVSLSSIGANPGASDNAAVIQAAINSGVRQLLVDGLYKSSALTLPSGFQLVGLSPTLSALIPIATMAPTDTFITNSEFSNTAGTRLAKDIYIANLTIDGTLRSPTFAKWLTKLDGTPITNPEADYLMGSGVLASGIAGVSLTAVISGDKVASVTVNNPGTGFAGHPTKPYLDDRVTLIFSGGGGTGAQAYVPIAGGSISGPAVITDPGHGYSSAPAVRTHGGYADAQLLADPTVNRRNPNFNQSGPAMRFDRVDRVLIENVVWTDYANRCLTDTGCRDLTVRRCWVIRCGKDDGPFMPFWAQSQGNPLAPGTTYQDTENIVFQDVNFYDLERLAILMAPTKGGAILNCRIINAKEGGYYVPKNAALNGGKIRIIGGEIKGIRRPEISAHGIEFAQPQNVEVSGLTIEDTDGAGMAWTGTINTDIHDCKLVNCGKAGTYLYRPETERFNFAAGQRPLAGSDYSPKPPVQVGYDGGQAQKNAFFHHNIIVETRAAPDHPASVFQQVRSGITPSALVQRLIVESNIIDKPADMPFWDNTLSGVFESAQDKVIRDNIGGDYFRRREDDDGNLVVERISGTGVQVLNESLARGDLKTMITALGLSANLVCCLDAISLASYDGTSQTWVDVSGLGNSFFRGATSAVEASDPAFVGVAGGLNPNTYFQGDGGDYFTPVGVPTFGANWHQAGAKFTVMMIVQIAAVANGTLLATYNSGGFGVQISLNASLQPLFQALNAGTAMIAQANPQALSTTDLCYYAISLDEAAEVGALASTTQVGIRQKRFEGAYSAHIANAASGAVKLWARPSSTQIMPAGVKMAALAVWDNRALSLQQLATLRSGLALAWPQI